MEQINILSDIIGKYSDKFDVENLQKNLVDLQHSVDHKASNIIYLPVDKTKVRLALEMCNPEILALKKDFYETKTLTRLIKVPVFSIEYKYEYYIHLCKTYERLKGLDLTMLQWKRKSINRYRNKLWSCFQPSEHDSNYIFDYKYVDFVLNNLSLSEHMKQKCKKYIDKYDAIMTEANKKYAIFEKRLDEYVQNINC